MSLRLDRVGEEGYNNFGSKIVIICYRNNTDIDIYFPEYDWYVYHVQYNKFKHGNIKCPYEPRVAGHGYIGEGEYKSVMDGIQTHCYKTWRGMLTRCYDNNYHNKKPTYIDCEVCEDWLNYQNFAKWYYDNYYEIDGEQMNLDKDILCKGNKIYSPETCVFVPQRINDMFCSSKACRGELPIGVHKHKCGKYAALCHIDHKQNYLGLFNTAEEAFLVYKQYKENVIKEVANEYINYIPYALYDSLINYDISIDD